MNNTSAIDIIFGLIMIYTTIHFFAIQHKAWHSRTSYEKVVSIAGMISTGLLFLGVMFGN